MTQLTVGAGGVSPQAPFSIKSTKFYFKHVLLFRFLVSIPIWQGFQYLLCVLVDNELAIGFLRFGLFLSLVSRLIPIYWLLFIWNGRLRDIFFFFPIFSSFSNCILQLFPMNYMFERHLRQYEKLPLFSHCCLRLPAHAPPPQCAEGWPQPG